MCGGTAHKHENIQTITSKKGREKPMERKQQSLNESIHQIINETGAGSNARRTVQLYLLKTHEIPNRVVTDGEGYVFVMVGKTNYKKAKSILKTDKDLQMYLKRANIKNVVSVDDKEVKRP